MEPEVQAVCYGAAILLFLVAAIPEYRNRVHLGWVGLAVFAVVFFWDAVEAS